MAFIEIWIHIFLKENGRFLKENHAIALGSCYLFTKNCWIWNWTWCFDSAYGFTFIKHYWNLHYIQGITCNISGFWIWQSGVLYYYQFRDIQQITFVTFIRFGLLLSKKDWPSLFFTNNIKLDEIIKTEYKIHACFEFCLKFSSYFLWKL